MQHKYDYIIVGQGIAGTMMDYYLTSQGSSVLIVDNPVRYSASKASCGILNPITGRRFHLSWRFPEFWMCAQYAYRAISNLIGIECMRDIQIHRKIEDRFINDWSSRMLRVDYQKWIVPGDEFESPAPGSWIGVQGGLIYARQLLSGYRQLVIDSNRLWEINFNPDELVVTSDGVSFRDITARGIVFAQGIQSTGNPYFKHVPLRPNPGEFIVANADHPFRDIVIKDKYFLLSVANDSLWVGSYNRWDDNYEPTTSGLEILTSELAKWSVDLKIDFEHGVGVRANTADRRPVVGQHPDYPQLFILNGFGTKGFSLAPYFALQLANYMTKGIELEPTVGADRFG